MNVSINTIIERIGVIERMAHSRWNHSIFIVPKAKPGEWRLVSDMRGINEVIEAYWIHSKP